jgi:hypothetical protein
MSNLSLIADASKQGRLKLSNRHKNEHWYQRLRCNLGYIFTETQVMSQDYRSW